MSILKEVEELVQWLSMRQEVNTLMVLEPLQRILSKLYEEERISLSTLEGMKDRKIAEYIVVW
jgi:hypothetical protein